MPLSIFRHHTLAVGDAIMALVGAWLAGEVLVLSLYSQEVLGYSPLVAGLIAIPQGVGGLLRGLVAARLLGRAGLRWFIAGNWVLAAVSIAVLFRSSVTSHYPVLGLVPTCCTESGFDEGDEGPMPASSCDWRIRCSSTWVRMGSPQEQPTEPHRPCTSQVTARVSASG